MNGNTEFSVGLIRYIEAMKETSTEKHALWNAFSRCFLSFQKNSLLLSNMSNLNFKLRYACQNV